MKDKSLPKAYGDEALLPIILPKQDELCKRLDDFWRIVGNSSKEKPSDMFRGALYAIERDRRSSNPDWMAQSAHSLREILYPFWKGNEKKKEYLKMHGSTGDGELLAKDISDYFGFVTSIAHHHQAQALTNPIFGKNKPTKITAEIFINTVSKFEDILFRALRRQIDAHLEIDSILKKEPQQVNIKEVRELLSLNPDACQYFFTKADERWLGWLFENGFLDAIKEKAEDPTRYGYRTPELNYLVKVAEKEPEKVADIMLPVSISAENFNPEVVDRFLYISSTLPAEQLARMVPKILSDNWVGLMAGFNSWGIEYEKMLKTLSDAKDYESIIKLAKAILSVRTKEDIAKIKNKITTDSPFYFNDLGQTNVFKFLSGVDDVHAEEALALVTDTMRNIILSGEKEGRTEIFKVSEESHFWDVDFFTLELSKDRHASHWDDVQNLAATIKKLAIKTIGGQCDDAKFTNEIYSKYFESLPDSQSMWRLRLFVLSLCPETFKGKLKEAFLRIFRDDDKPWELIMGAEYERAVHVGIKMLSDKEKRNYVTCVFEYFGKREGGDTGLWKHSGWSILASIFSELTEEEKKKAEDIFGTPLNPDYEPQPSIVHHGMAGKVISQAPITLEELQKMTIRQIADNLQKEWSPKALVRKYDAINDFHHPIDAEGVGTLIKSDMANRPKEYLDDAKLFFDRENLDSHYTYAFLQGILDLIRGKKICKADIKGLLVMFSYIIASGEKEPFDFDKRERESGGAWLAGWSVVHTSMADITKELLNEDNVSIVDFKNNRDNLLKLIDYLLKQPNPNSESEKEESPRTNARGEVEYTGSDPFTRAINSVRGRAFEALVNFSYQDSKEFEKKVDIRIADDVKNIYKELLATEDTQAVMFMFGHYLPSFYFRDKNWIRNLLPQIFSLEKDKENLYLAAWEGLLTNNLYGEMFFDPVITNLYERGIKFNPEDYTKRRYFKNIDEVLATHLALAFVHFPEFGLEHKLFKQFWATKNHKRHKEFISFAGRHCLSRTSAKKWMEENGVDVEKLKKFWDWALENYDTDELSEFGYWVNPEGNVLDVKWLAQHMRLTLEKTQGYIDWEYGLMHSLPILAKKSPEDALAILRIHLMEEVAKHEPQRAWFHVDEEVVGIFKLLYENPKIKEGVRLLINNLLPYRNGIFWELKSVLDSESNEEA